MFVSVTLQGPFLGGFLGCQRGYTFTCDWLGSSFQIRRSVLCCSLLLLCSSHQSSIQSFSDSLLGRFYSSHGHVQYIIAVMHSNYEVKHFSVVSWYDGRRLQYIAYFLCSSWFHSTTSDDSRPAIADRRQRLLSFEVVRCEFEVSKLKLRYMPMRRPAYPLFERSLWRLAPK
jgi:hypothetical protein